MRVNRLLAAAAALFIAVLPARADQLLPQGRILGSDPANGDILFGALKLGKRQGGKTLLQPDAVQIQGSGSTGDVSGMSVQTAPTVQRSLLSKIGDLPVTLPDVGATCDGSSLIDLFWTALSSDARTIVVPNGSNCRVASTMTLPKGKLYRVEGSGRITVDAGKTLTIRGRFDAPLRQVFYGAGTVLGLRYNRPEWWGAQTGYGTTFDNAPAVNAAVRSAEASYSPSDPANPSDGGRPTVDIGGGGSWNVCSPVHHHPRPSAQFTFRGSGQINGGSQIIACPTFTGGAVFEVHGIAPSDTFGSWDSVFEDFSIYDPNRLSTACFRTVPEGAGYVLNSGNQRPSRLSGVTAQGCPIGFDIVNTLQMTIRDPAYLGIGTSNNVGMRFAAVGTDATANTGEITVYDANLDPCTVHSAASCSNTTNVQMQASGGSGSPTSSAVAAINFIGNNIMWAANIGLDLSATAGGYIGDIWNFGTQFDGVGCSYFRGIADGANSVIVNIHNDHLYHTAVKDTSCLPHLYNATNGGKISFIWETNGEYILGASTNSPIWMAGVTNVVISGNQLTGGGGAVPAINLINVSKGTVFGNTIDALAVSTPWTNGVLLNGSTKVAVTGNLCSGISGACVTGLDGTSVSTGNVGP